MECVHCIGYREKGHPRRTGHERPSCAAVGTSVPASRGSGRPGLACAYFVKRALSAEKIACADTGLLRLLKSNLGGEELVGKTL